MVSSPTGRAFGAYALVLIAIVMGTAGMGLVFDAATGGGLTELLVGLPLLFAGLWWTSRAMQRSMAARRATRGEASHRQP
jgi:hypothetical protein